MGGALFVSLAIPAGFSAKAAESQTSLDPTLLASWLEIRSDNTILMRTGRTETGTGHERVLCADDCRGIERPAGNRSRSFWATPTETPDGGYSAGFLTGASQRTQSRRVHVPGAAGAGRDPTRCSRRQSYRTDGIVSGGGKSISYGQLVQGQHLDLKIPVTASPRRSIRRRAPESAGLDGFTVTGDPPMKPMSQYKVIGTSYPMPAFPTKSPARRNGVAMSRCPECCMRAWCGQRRSARR